MDTRFEDQRTVRGLSEDGDEARVAVSRAGALLVDWDGCIAMNNRPLPAAVRFLKENANRVAIVSNNSTHRPEDFARILEENQIPISPHRIVLAGAEALRRARELAESGVMVVGHARMRDYARSVGLTLVEKDAALVVLMRDPLFNYSKLARAANSVRGGAKLVVSNPDFVHPGARGQIVPETGALLEALKACLRTPPVDIEVIGKPSRHLFDKACQALGVTSAQALMIGDNPATDGVGARQLGSPWVLLGAGSTITFDQLLAHPPRR